MPSAGASVAFADPALDSTVALPAWRPDLLRHALDAVVALDAEDHRRALLADLRCERTLVANADQGQVLMLRAAGNVLGVALEGSPAMHPTARVTFVVPETADEGRAAQGFKMLGAIRSGRITGRKRWSVRAINDRDSLIALDGDRAGATYREIAEVIYGADRAAAAWRKNDSLKDHVRRMLTRGEKLMRGDYLDRLR